MTDLYANSSSSNSHSITRVCEKTKRSFSFDTMNDFDISKLQITPQTIKQKTSYDSLSTISTANSESIYNQNNGNINIITQNLILSDKVMKLIVIGDKGIGKTTLINKILENIDINSVYSKSSFGNNENSGLQEYIPTQTLEIKKKLINVFNNRIITVELWDTNTAMTQSNLIKTYYKICQGIIAICNIDNHESIKFIENQLDIIINSSYNDPNILLYVNMNENVELNTYYSNLNYLSLLAEKYSLKINYINLTAAFNNAYLQFTRFIYNYLIKKETTMRRSKQKNVNKSSNDGRSDYSSNYSSIEKKIEFEQKYNRDMSASPKAKKKDNCLIF